jgi:hypothetical protein
MAPVYLFIRARRRPAPMRRACVVRGRSGLDRARVPTRERGVGPPGTGTAAVLAESMVSRPGSVASARRASRSNFGAGPSALGRGRRPGRSRPRRQAPDAPGRASEPRVVVDCVRPRDKNGGKHAAPQSTPRSARIQAETHPFSSPSDSTFILICESDTVNRSTSVRADKF